MTTINWLMLFTEIIVVYFANHMKHINTVSAKCTVNEHESTWYRELPLRFEMLTEVVSPYYETRETMAVNWEVSGYFACVFNRTARAQRFPV
jgi:hypothetical protein